MKKHLPNFLTSLNLLFGWTSIFCSFNNKFEKVFFLIAIASVFDFFDGYVAKKLNVKSKIGGQLDSFADLVTFGIAPTIVVYNILISHYKFYDSILQITFYFFLGLIPLFSAFRLAKFNVSDQNSSEFIGLPTPAFALSSIAISLLFLDLINYNNFLQKFIFLYPLIIVFLAFLMVSKLKFISFKFKTYDFSPNKSRYSLIFSTLLIIIIMLILGNKLLIMPLVIAAYIIFSLVENIK